MTGHYFTDVAVCDEVPQVQHGRVGAGLQAHHVADAGRLRQLSHLLRLRGGASQRPLGVDVLAGVDGGDGGIVVVGHSQADGHGVDVRVSDHFVVVVECQARAEHLSGLLGALHAGGADGGELELGAGDDGGQVGTDGPAAVNVGAYDAQANLVGHDDAPALVCGHRSTGGGILNRVLRLAGIHGYGGAVMPYGDNDWLALTTEETLEPELPICDAHHHFWDFRSERVPYQRYLLHEFAADINSGHNVRSTVFLEARSMYRPGGPEELRPVGEVEFVQGLAAASDTGLYGPGKAAAAIVGHADLNLGADVARVLDALQAASPNRFRGIRHNTGWDPHPEVESRSFDGQLQSADFRAGAQVLASRGTGIRQRGVLPAAGANWRTFAQCCA